MLLYPPKRKTVIVILHCSLPPEYSTNNTRGPRSARQKEQHRRPPIAQPAVTQRRRRHAFQLLQLMYFETQDSRWTAATGSSLHLSLFRPTTLVCFRGFNLFLETLSSLTPRHPRRQTLNSSRAHFATVMLNLAYEIISTPRCLYSTTNARALDNPKIEGTRHQLIQTQHRKANRSVPAIILLEPWDDNRVHRGSTFHRLTTKRPRIRNHGKRHGDPPAFGTKHGASSRNVWISHGFSAAFLLPPDNSREIPSHNTEQNIGTWLGKRSLLERESGRHECCSFWCGHAYWSSDPDNGR